METQFCPACGAAWRDGKTCEDDFHQMLFWEAEFPELGIVHHLMVLCYHLQHPHLYSPEGLRYAMGLLNEFVVEGASPAEVRKHHSASVDSGNRKFKITSRATSKGAYEHSVRWTMTAADVVAGGADHYCDNVEKWAQTVHNALKAATII
jgi:hypothetical protein